MGAQTKIHGEMAQNPVRDESAPGYRGILSSSVGIVISSCAAVFLALHLFFPSIRIDAIGLSLIVLAMLPWLLPLLRRYLASGKIFGQEFTFLQERIDNQKKEIENQGEIIRLIHEALKRSLTKYEYQHLAELDPNTPSSNFLYSDFLRDEMIRLCQHGYATEAFDCSTWKMKDKGDARFDLKEFYRITEEGKQHLDLLRRLQEAVTS